MEEVQATLSDGAETLVSDFPALLDFGDAPGGSPDSAGWHAHATLPLGVILEPGEQMRIETADGRSGPVVMFDGPTFEGDQALYVFTGIGPLATAGS